MNILTFDMEDWWVYEYYHIGIPKDYLPRLQMYLDHILDELDDKKMLATFFCLGIMAEKYPFVIKQIAERGHHIGCHSYSHTFFQDSSYRIFEEDTKKAIDILEQIVGRNIDAYRAPAFSITEKNKWALEILAKNGIEYDCSIFPSTRSFGGFSSYNSYKPAVVEYNGIEIKEFPIPLTYILGKGIAYSGGGYFRLFPYWKLKSIIENSAYVMTYFHLKDFDSDQTKIYNIMEGENKMVRYLKNYYGLSSCFKKFNTLINDFSFMSIKCADKLIDWENVEHIRL